MAIKIIEEPEIVLTRSEYDRLRGQYEEEHRVWWATVPPPSFEEWVRLRNQSRQRQASVTVADGTQPHNPRYF